MNLIIIILISLQLQSQMDKRPPYQLNEEKFNGKNFLVPIYNLYGCQKYMLPKLNNASVHHTFFKSKELQEMYEKEGVDPKELNFNLEKEVNLDGMEIKKTEDIKELSMSMDQQQQELTIDQKMNEPLKKKRPPLRKNGFTHFIHVPFVEALRQTYENQIVPLVDEQDRDLLQPLQTMHMTVMVFKLKQESDLKEWHKVLKSAKRARANIRGVNIFSVKKNFGRVLYLNIKGLQDLLDRIVSKAIELQLLTQKELSYIRFDKVSEIYKAEQPHISLLRTKGDDLYDFTDYLKRFKDINLSKIPITDVHLSMIGSFDGQDYYNEQIVKL